MARTEQWALFGIHFLQFCNTCSKYLQMVLWTAKSVKVSSCKYLSTYGINPNLIEQLPIQHSMQDIIIFMLKLGGNDVLQVEVPIRMFTLKPFSNWFGWMGWLKPEEALAFKVFLWNRFKLHVIVYQDNGPTFWWCGRRWHYYTMLRIVSFKHPSTLPQCLPNCFWLRVVFAL